MTIDAATLLKNLDDPMWRLNNLYKIITKGDDEDDEELVVQFKPNRAQRRLLARLWHRNIILKARQLGFTTLVTILWLDTALFSKFPIRCGIIAQDREKAEEIFRDKVRFAYDNLPEQLRERFPLARANASRLEFAHNGASIRVGTSMRSGTLHRLLVSEFGKICAKHPDKAKEVVTGSIPAVPKSGMLIIESTAEGQEGAFYEMTSRAQAQHEMGADLTEKDYRFHFYAWWEAPEYEIDPTGVIMSEADLIYFSQLEAQIGRKLTAGQKAWYVTTRDSDFNGDAPTMWQEYPSTPKEAFQVSTEGCYYSTQLATTRTQGRIRPSLPVEKVPVNTFWDLGRGDMTTIWFHQRVGPENRFLRYYEASGEELDHYVSYLQKTPYIWGKHYLPHEADYKRLGKNADENRSLKEMLEDLMPGQTFEIVPRVTQLITGIQATRNAFASCWFDETGCKLGLQRLGAYRKTWNRAMGRWGDEAQHNDDSHGADAFRQFGQEADAGNVFEAGYANRARSRSRTGSAWAA